MTTIIMAENFKGITIGYDSQATYGDNIAAEKGLEKVFVSNGIIFGVAGSCLFNAEIRFLDFPSFAGGDPLRWVVKDLIPAVRTLRKDIDEKGDSALNLLVVVGGKVFEILDDLSVNLRRDGQYAIGSGHEFVRGALATGASVEAALTAASKLDVWTGGALKVTSAEALLSVQETLNAV